MKICAKSRITGIGSYLPREVLSSQSIMDEIGAKRFGLSNSYIDRTVGICERRVAKPNEQPSDLATIASLRALEDACISASDIDVILYCGITTDNEEPATAHSIQHNLEASNATVWDLSNACLGFFNGLVTADALIGSACASTVLICTGEKFSDVVTEFVHQLRNTNDKNEFRAKVGMLTLGDGGGAMIIQSTETGSNGWQWGNLLSSGEHRNLCKYKVTTQGVEGQMLMKEICEEGMALHEREIGYTYSSLHWNASDVVKLYCHQVGAPLLVKLSEITGVGLEKFPVSYDRFGNLASATVPVLMDLSRPDTGDRVLFMGAGSGLSIFQGGMIF